MLIGFSQKNIPHIFSIVKNILLRISSLLTVMVDEKELRVSTIAYAPGGNSNTCKSEPKSFCLIFFSISVYLNFLLKTIYSRSLLLLFFKFSKMSFLKEFSPGSDNSSAFSPIF